MKSFWSDARRRFWQQKSGIFGASLLLLFIFIALYAPFLASSKPIVVQYNGEWYFPLFRYLFSSNFYTKPIDLFFNIAGALLPLFFVSYFLPRKYIRLFCGAVFALILSLFLLFNCFISLDPAADTTRLGARLEAQSKIDQKQQESAAVVRTPDLLPNFAFDLAYMTPYAQLNMVIDQRNLEMQDARIEKILKENHSEEVPYTLFYVQKKRKQEIREQLTQKIALLSSQYKKSRQEEEELRQKPDGVLGDPEKIKQLSDKNRRFEELQNRLQYMNDKEAWLQNQQKEIHYCLMPLIRPLHWEDDAGGDQALNIEMPTLELSRLNRQDLMAALLFGARIALFVGIIATWLQLIIGIPLGLVAGYYAGRTDIILSRFVEIWESMPAFFMLLLIVTVMQTKSLFIIITIIALFSWTSIFRFVRAETFRQREIPYIEAVHALGFPTPRILFGHLFPNAIVPVIALLPFDIMGAITREAGLSFLGLGEELSCSWGQLMDEGRSAFPAESALLWPPAIALTLLLLGIAFVGDALITVLNPKERV